MNRYFVRWALHATLIVALVASASAQSLLIDDFSGGLSKAWSLTRLKAATVDVTGADTLSGGQAVELTRDAEPGLAVRAVPARDWRRFESLSFYARVESPGPVDLRVLAMERGSPRGFQHRVTLPPTGWREIRLPLKSFRWNNDQVGDFSNIGQLAFQWSNGSGRLGLDDLRLLPGTRGLHSARPSLGERLELAFPNGTGRLLESAHFGLLTDAPELFGTDGKKLLDRLEQALQALQIRYAVQGDLEEKVPFFIFHNRDDYRAFFPRLGASYHAFIAEPKSDGYSVLDLTASWYDPKQGWDRPVYVHEAIHPVICQLLRLAVNGNWVQEALAAGVQASLHAESTSRLYMAQQFQKRASGRSSGLLSWQALLSMRHPPVTSYAQLVSILDFLQSEHLAALPKIWDKLRKETRPMNESALAAIASVLGQRPEDLERRWLEWGARYYAPK